MKANVFGSSFSITLTSNYVKWYFYILCDIKHIFILASYTLYLLYWIVPPKRLECPQIFFPLNSNNKLAEIQYKKNWREENLTIKMH